MWNKVKEEQALSQGWNLFVVGGTKIEVQKADFPEDWHMDSYQTFETDKEAFLYVNTTAYYGMANERDLCKYALMLMNQQHEQ